MAVKPARVLTVKEQDDIARKLKKRSTNFVGTAVKSIKDANARVDKFAKGVKIR